MPDKKPIIKIIIADDHTLFLEGLSSLLKDFKDIHIVGSALNGIEVLQILKTKKVDVVISDINMPEMDGLKLAKEIKKSHHDIKIIALTMLNEAGIISAMLKSGITGYLLKNTGKEELYKAITTVMKDETFFSEEVKKTMMESIIPGKKTRPHSAIPELSERDLEILKLIAEELTQQEIAEKLFISPHTVIFHKRNLFHKFDVKNTAGLIKSAMELNLLA